MSPRTRLSLGRQRLGLTLVEMLVATALTLILFGAVAEMFSRMGASVNDARSTIELSGNLRTAGNHLRRDLSNLTAQVGPWSYPGTNQGYFQIVEGPDRDIDYASKQVFPSGATFAGSVAGDADDVISFTAYSKEKPFVGLIQGRLVPAPAGSSFKYLLDGSDPSLFTPITSHYAEVVYFTKLTPFDDRQLRDYSTPGLRDPDETVTLFRRILLIRPDIDVHTALNGQTFLQVRNNYDLSVRANAITHWFTNSLEDLQDRRNRVGHFGPGAGLTPPAPYPMNPSNLFTFEQLHDLAAQADTPVRNRIGEDVLMRKVLAFDVKVFDPNAPLREDRPAEASSLTVLPGDLAYGNNQVTHLRVDGNGHAVLRGAFVDLNWNRGNQQPYVINGLTGQPYGLLAAPHENSIPLTMRSIQDLHGGPFPQMPSMLLPFGGDGTRNPEAQTSRYATYDTWPYDPTVKNGFDDNGDGIIDGLAEWSTAPNYAVPPYPVPLRGLQINIRAIEDGTRIIRQDTVTTNFMPR